MIGFLLLVLFLILLGKAILETMWGGCLIIYGAVLYVLFIICEILIFLDRRRKTAALCVLGICAATAISYAQTNETPITQTATAPNPNMMPVSRTLTSADGRTIEVVITAKTPTNVTAKKADGKEFEIALDKLSDADRAFVAGLVELTVKKPTLLFVVLTFGEDKEEIIKQDKEKLIKEKSKILLDQLRTAGFEVQTQLSFQTKLPSGRTEYIWPEIDKMSDQQLKSYDVIWKEVGPSKRMLTLIPTYQGAMVIESANSARLKEFLAGRGEADYGRKPYVKIDGNLIRYEAKVTTWHSSTGSYSYGPQQPEFIDQAIAEVKKLLKK